MSLRGKRVTLAVEEIQAPSGGKSEWLERGDHPLLNDLRYTAFRSKIFRHDVPLILDTLFGFVRRREMKACRLVRKNWNLHTIPHMRANFQVTIRGNNSSKPVTTFAKLFSSNELGIPFETFKLGIFCTRDGVGLIFLRLCGEIASEIDLDEGPSEEYTIEDVSELIRSCPNLKVLGFSSRIISGSGSVVQLFPDSAPSFPSLKTITFHRGSDALQKCCPSAIEELLTAAPHISDIIVSDVPHCPFLNAAEDGDDVSKISCVLNCIEKLGRESSIQSLHLHNARVRHFEHLLRLAGKEKGLKLKSLTFKPDLNIAENFAEMEIQLAAVFQDTLQSLRVHLVAENNLMEFLIMPHLKSLTFVALPSSDPVSIKLTKIFPTLEGLDITFGALWDGRNFFSQFDSNPTIKSLRVHSRGTTIQTLNGILVVFPNLTKLNLSVGNGNGREEILRQIWSEMTGLKSLSITICTGGTENESLDSLFTGIPTETLEEIRPLVTGYGFDVLTVQQKTETILRLTEQHSRLPSIRNLTKLRHMVWDAGTHLILTDVTAYLGFYSMSRLRHLHVQACMFTKACCEILTEETGIQSWGFLNQYHIIPPFGLCESQKSN